MTSFAIVKFASQKEKSRFKAWLGSLKEPLKKDGRKLRIGDNEDKEERKKGRIIAKVSRALHEAKEGRKDLTTDYRNFEAFIGRKCVDYFEGDTLQLKGEALTLQKQIQALVDEKSKAEDGDSEE